MDRRSRASQCRIGTGPAWNDIGGRLPGNDLNERVHQKK
jgi:hypothetical protein